ncbi:hypothetical protein [Pareuzebyella sediminis]|uniref:hypothetical protein n=1 Tax=Pareuzebyella sediminis TaxID=2607998 RepID=UPI0011EDACC2|nr:hypothetical protein [Pareuzebyella sediminis]
METIVLFDTRLKAVLEAFNEALTHRELCYDLSTLTHYGFSGSDEINLALKRTMSVFKGLGIDPKQHFGYFYRVDISKGQTSRQWRASKLGFYLVLSNGLPRNPYTGALQLEMLNAFLEKLQ